MKNYLHIFIKGAFVLFLIAYLTVLYTSDSAKNVPMEQIAQTMEQDSDITSLNKEARSDLKHYYQTDDRNIDGYFFYKAASPMAVEEICIMKATDNTQANTLLENANAHLSGQKQVFEGYGTDQMALLNNAVVRKKRKLCILYVRRRRTELAHCLSFHDISYFTLILVTVPHFTLMDCRTITMAVLLIILLRENAVKRITIIFIISRLENF